MNDNAIGATILGNALKKRQLRRRRKIIAGLVTLSVISAASIGFAATVDPEERYRVAEVTYGNVAQNVAVNGSVSTASRDDAAFAVSGTIATIDVAVGDQVIPGQTLATLDSAPLEEAVTQAEESLATAEQQLADNLAAQAAASVAATASVAETTVTVTNVAWTVTTPLPVDPDSNGSDSAGLGDAPDMVPSNPADETTLESLQEQVRQAQEALLKQYETVQTLIEQSSQLLSEVDGQLGSSSISINDAAQICEAFLTDAGNTGDSSDGSGADTGTDPDVETLPGNMPEIEPDGELEQNNQYPEPEPSDAQPQLQAIVENASFRLAVNSRSTDLFNSCQTALRQVITEQGEINAAQFEVKMAQEMVNQGQQQLLNDVETLDAAVTALNQAVSELLTSQYPEGEDGSGPAGGGSQPPSGGGGAGRPGGEYPQGGGNAPGGQYPGAGVNDQLGGGSNAGGMATQSITAEQILADRAAITEAEANLAIQQDNLQQATLSSRIAGTVAEISVSTGSQVNAATPVIVVIGDDNFLINTTISLTQRQLIAAGQTVTASVAGTSEPFTGKVSRIGIENVSTTGTPAYAVTITLDDAEKAPFYGASAWLQIAVASATDVLVIPTSALTVEGTERSVQILTDGTATTVPVQVGAIGPELTEITAGLEAGQMVILAELDQPLTNDNTNSNTGLTGIYQNNNQLSGPAGGPGGTGGNRGGGQTPPRTVA